MNTGGGSTPLHEASDFHRLKCVRALIAAGADVNAKDDFGKTALALAARRNLVDRLLILIEAGANVSLAIQANAQTTINLDEDVLELLRHFERGRPMSPYSLANLVRRFGLPKSMADSIYDPEHFCLEDYPPRI